MSRRGTLIPPPPSDPSLSPIENLLALKPLPAISPNLYTNLRPLPHPPTARGIFGGVAIAQTLSAAYATVPSTFDVHSMHCYFVLAGDSGVPVIYDVENVRDGRSFATRTVQARQRGAVIFSVTMSFVKNEEEGHENGQSKNKKTLEHQVGFQPGEQPPEIEDGAGEGGVGGVFERRSITPIEAEGTNNNDHITELPIHQKRTRQWIRARGRISDKGGHKAHLSALAYMSDSYFLGTVTIAHGLWKAEQHQNPTAKPNGDDDDTSNAGKNKKAQQTEEKHLQAPRLGMMVSLDHNIWIHAPRAFRADEWLYAEMDTPWSGDGRGLALQRIFTKDGVLVATCAQEGLVRLKQDDGGKSSKL